MAEVSMSDTSVSVRTDQKTKGGTSRRVIGWTSAGPLALVISSCGLIKPPPPPEPTFEEFVTCQVTRTECTNWVEDDTSVIDEVNCPSSAIGTNQFTATECVTTTASTSANDAQAACNLYCNGNETTGGLYPLGFLVKPGSNVLCSAAVTGNVPQAQLTPGLCTVAATSPGATSLASCTIGGRLCENIESTEDGTEFCSTMPETAINFSKCFDPSQFLAENLCENSLQFPPNSSGTTLDQFPWWRVNNVTPNASACAVAAAPLTAFGIGAVSIGSAVAFGTTVPLVAKGGFMTTSTHCDADNEFCSTTLNTLQVQLADFTVGGFTVRNPVARLVAPAASSLGSIPAGAMTLQVEADLALGHALMVMAPAQPVAISASGTSASLVGSLSGMFNANLEDVAPFSLALNVSGSTTSSNAGCSGETAQQQLLGFELLQDWTAGQGATVALTPDLHTQGCFGMQVGGSGYRTVNSTQFATPLAGTTSTLALDVFIPPNQPNQSWLGAVQLYLSCPSANFNNQYIGQAELTGKPVGQFSTFTYPIPGPIETVLKGSHPDCSFSMAVNMNQTPTPPVVDNLRFQ
jgi:hypothetical protein